MRILFFLILSFPLAFVAHFSNAQISPQEEALQLFEKEKYTEALPFFKRMITMFPKDPRYQYYTGACMVQNNLDLKKAIEYLKFAADRDVPRDIYYFIGKAYSYQYLFDDALDAFLKFQQFGDRTQKEKWQCDMNISMARNARTIVLKQLVLNVYKTDTVNQENLFDVYNGFVNAGKFREKQEKNFSFRDSRTRSFWRFVPTLTDKSQPIFETTTTGLAHKNQDITITHHLTENEWSRSENIGSVINTPFDEDFAYYNAAEPALYFSSKGHNSMGGYDIFKSVYNPDTKTWNEPVNLGFPINSPYDDFLFVSSDDQSKAYFASNRETHGSRLKIYTISFSSRYSVIDCSPSEALILKSYLRPKNSEKPVNGEKKTIAKGVKKNPDTPIPVNPKISESPQPYPDELLNHSEYNQLLNEAMHFQLQSDSLGRVSEDLKQKMENSKNEGEKEKFRKTISTLDSRSKTAQQKADEYYDKARAFEKTVTANISKNKENPRSSPDLVKNALKGKKQPDNKSNSETENKTEKQKTAFKPPQSRIIYEFKIMSVSPYASANQIPLNQPLPEGLIYRIQMGSFSKSIEPERFKGIVPISGETVQNGAITKYYAGLFSKNADAEKALNKIREIGFKDAFIIAFYNGHTIPSNRARELEKERM